VFICLYRIGPVGIKSIRMVIDVKRRLCDREIKEVSDIKVGIPGGLLYYRYETLIHTLLNELDIECIFSTETNREILDMGINCCVNEACLPMKIFHGHASNLKNKCDLLWIPRIMRGNGNEAICPKFCGLPEMVKSGIKRREGIIDYPLYLNCSRAIRYYLKKLSKDFGCREDKIYKAFNKAATAYGQEEKGIRDKRYPFTIFLGGHPYNIYDNFANMNLIDKLHSYGIGVITEEQISSHRKEEEIKHLMKKPYWLFYKNNYGAGKYLVKNQRINGIVYISSFSCGIDSITIELLKNDIEDFPLLILKVDEHTGEAGMNTRIEAFADMLERRKVH